MQSIIVWSQSNICLLLSIRPDRGVEVGHINVVEILHSLSALVLVGLDIRNEHSALLSSVFLMADSVVRGKLDDSIVVNMFLLGPLF